MSSEAPVSPGAPVSLGAPVDSRVTAAPTGHRRLQPGRIASAAWLVVVWALLWDSVTPLVVLGGVVMAALVLTVFPIPAPPTGGRLSPVALARLLLYLAWDLLVSSARVAWQAVRPGAQRLNSVVEVPLLHARSDALMALIVNGIGITPGSLVVEVDLDNGVMHLHQLAADTEQERRRLRHHVLRIEELSILAIGSDDERARLRSGRDVTAGEAR